MFGFGRRQRTATPVQRMCGVCFSLFILFQTPLFTLPVSRSGRVHDMPLSALEVTAIYMLHNDPQMFTHTSQLMLLPGVWGKLLSRAAFLCLNKGPSSPACQPHKLWDLEGLLAASNYTHMVQPFYTTLPGGAANTLAIASSMLTACAVATPVVPDMWVTVAALALFVYGVFTSACGPLPTTMFMGLLAVTATFGSNQQPLSAKIKEQQQRWKEERGAGAGGSAGAAAEAKASPTKAASRGKKKK